MQITALEISKHSKTYKTVEALNKGTSKIDADLEECPAVHLGTSVFRLVMEVPGTGRLTAVYILNGGARTWAQDIARAGFTVCAQF